FGAVEDQLLFGNRQFQRGLLADGFSGLQLEPAVGAEDRLAQGGLVQRAAARAGHGAGVGVDLAAAVGNAGGQGNVRQQAGAGLGHHFTASFDVRDGGRDVGTVHRRQLVYGHQVRTRGGGGLLRQGRAGNNGG